MNKTICFLAILTLLSACKGGEQKTTNNEQQTADTTATEANMDKPADVNYTQCTLAYLVEGELYFYSLDANQKVKFVEEPDTIFNFTFD